MLNLNRTTSYLASTSLLVGMVVSAHCFAQQRLPVSPGAQNNAPQQLGIQSAQLAPARTDANGYAITAAPPITAATRVAPAHPVTGAPPIAPRATAVTPVVAASATTNQAPAQVQKPIQCKADFCITAGTGAGNDGVLRITAHIGERHHIGSITQSTQIHIEPSNYYDFTGPFLADRAILIATGDNSANDEHHDGVVTWSAPIRIAPDIDPNSIHIRGYLSGQICVANESCRALSQKETAFTATHVQDLAGHTTNVAPVAATTRAIAATPVVPAAATTPLPPAAAPFAPAVPMAPATPLTFRTAAPMPTTPQFPAMAAAQPVATAPSTMAAPTLLAADTAATAVADATGGRLATTLKFFALAFGAGFLLNFMPCVLPVIGLKVMSFVQQAGESRSRVLMLNLFFVWGLMSVFMVLACLTAFLGYSWGGLFQLPAFSIAMISIVFVFALSLLGVWEIPSPGFAGRGAAVDLAEKEGLMGAFSKGVLTTLLATPCTGPLLGTALGWAIDQPRPVIFGSFACMGFGMGLPYLLFAMSPRLMNFLPKPGAWMDTFKQVMGFVLLGTVVWLFYGLGGSYVVPTIALIFTLWAACWAIGRVPFTAKTSTKWINYAGALAFAGIVGYWSFNALYTKPVAADFAASGGEWPNYTKRADIDEFVNKGVPVFVDFTANW